MRVAIDKKKEINAGLSLFFEYDDPRNEGYVGSVSLIKHER